MEAAERELTTGMLAEVAAVAEELVPEEQVLLPITVKPLVEILPFKAVRKLMIMPLVAEVAEATNTVRMDTWANMAEVAAVAVLMP